MTLLCAAVASFLLTGKKLSISCVFKAWAGRIGVQIFIFFCALKEGLKEVFFFFFYIYVYFARLGLRKKGGFIEWNGKKICYFQSEKNQNGNNKKTHENLLCLPAITLPLCFPPVFLFYFIFILPTLCILPPAFLPPSLPSCIIIIVLSVLIYLPTYLPPYLPHRPTDGFLLLFLLLFDLHRMHWFLITRHDLARCERKWIIP